MSLSVKILNLGTTIKKLLSINPSTGKLELDGVEVGGGGSADLVTVSTTNFSNNLSMTDNTVQKAFDTIDALAASGTDGADGADGVDGASAFEVWLGLGNTGTEQDFIDSLKGLNGTIDNAIALNTGVWTDSGKRRRGKMVEWILIEAGALPNNTTKAVAIPSFNSTLYDYFVDAAESVAFDTGNYSLGLSYVSAVSSFIKYHISYSTGSVILGAIGTDYSIYDNTELVVRRITK